MILQMAFEGRRGYSPGDMIIVSGHRCVITSTTGLRDTGITEGYFHARVMESFAEDISRLSETIHSFLSTAIKKSFSRAANEPWYGDYATRALASSAYIEQNALHKPELRRCKSAALDRTRYKRRRFLQQLRTT